MQIQNKPISIKTAQLSYNRMRINFSIFFIVAILVFCHEALAFRKHSAGDLERRIAVLSEQLDLTDEQVAQIRPILEHRMQQRKAVFEAHRSQGTVDRQALRSQMQALREDTHSQIKTVLTEEQINRYQVWQENRAQKMGRRGGLVRKRAGNRID